MALALTKIIGNKIRQIKHMREVVKTLEKETPGKVSASEPCTFEKGRSE